jgi:hypothetical protein
VRLDPFPRFPADKGQTERKLTDLFRDVAKQVNDLTEGRIAAVTNAASSVPTTGTWNAGDFVRNSAPAEAGVVTAKYVVTGWIRLTSGSNNVLNTDWVAARVLTGN